MDLNLDVLKQYASMFGTGLMKQMTPGVASGFINKMVSQWHLSVAIVTKYVETNRSLWYGLTPYQRRQIGDLAKRVGNLDFITPEFFINSIKKDSPNIASLFLHWPEAAEWLASQIGDLKAGVNGTDIESH